MQRADVPYPGRNVHRGSARGGGFQPLCPDQRHLARGMEGNFFHFALHLLFAPVGKLAAQACGFERRALQYIGNAVRSFCCPLSRRSIENYSEPARFPGKKSGSWKAA
jgi:hypothetical protein